MLKNYLKIAWRNLVKNRVYSLLNLAGLSIGLTVVMLISLYIKDELSFDRFHKNSQSIYRIVHESRDPTGKEGGGGNSGAVEGPTFLNEIPEVTAFCRVYSGGEALIKVKDEVVSERIMLADTSFFTMFSFPLLEGNPADVLKGTNSVVISEELALKYFNSLNVVGKTLEINQDGQFSPYIISAVSQKSPINSTISVNLLINIEKSLQPQWTQEWLSSFLNTFVQLKPNANMPLLNKKMVEVFDKHAGEKFAKFKEKFGNNIYYRYRLQPLATLHTDNYYNVGNGLTQGSNIKYSYILGGIALFILAIASINFINLSLARSFRRSKEIGIRKINGSGRRQLIIQFMGESFLLNLFAVSLSLLLVYFTIPVFAELTNKKLSLSYLFTIQNTWLFIALFVVNTLLSGFYPAVILSGFRPLHTLYGQIKLAGQNYFGKALIILQFTVAIFLIVGMVVMQQQFHYLINQSPGYNAKNIVDISLPANQQVDITAMKNELLQAPSIKQVGSQSISFTDFNNTMIKTDTKEIYDVALFKMDEQILPMLSLPIINGRNFNGALNDSLSCIVNQSLVKLLGWKNPLDKKIAWEGKELTIVGVVKNFNVTSFKEKMHPTFIHQLPSWGIGHVMVQVEPQQTQKAIETIQAAFKKFIPYYPCQYNFLDNQLKSQYENEQRWKNIISIAAGLSIFISCLGLFGLATLSTEQRAKEIGIRKVLGASIPGILRLFSSNFMRLILIAFLIASPIAWWATNKWLNDFAYKINVSWWIFLMAGSIALLIAFITISIQTLRAALVNPVKSLRSE